MSTDPIDDNDADDEPDVGAEDAADIAESTLLMEEYERVLDPLPYYTPVRRWGLAKTLKVILGNGFLDGTGIAVHTGQADRTERDHIAKLRTLFHDRITDDGERERMRVALDAFYKDWENEATVSINLRKRRDRRRRRKS